MVTLNRKFTPQSVKIILPLTKIDPTKPLTNQKVQFLDLGNLIRRRVVSIETGTELKAVKVAPVPVGRQALYGPTATIRLLRKTNPRHKGTFAYKQFELYRKVQTVSEFIKRGGDRGYLNWDASHGNIRVSERARGPGRKAA